MPGLEPEDYENDGSGKLWVIGVVFFSVLFGIAFGLYCASGG